MSFLAPPPPLSMAQDGSQDLGGSYTPVIVALVIIATLTVASVAVGQLCVGRCASDKPNNGWGDFVKRKFHVCKGGGKAEYDVALPEEEEEEDDLKKKNKKGGDLESATVEEVEVSEPPQMEEEEDGGACGASS
uniref:Uncharacterized protein n=1 Tax=Leersia perrieri TaxID=77586 RepID=A0A0D9WGK7_9ORYZ